ncbi:MAG: hypothetical protein IH935_06400 [Acidobacteria bacterium]|nr:hypothetical protein [Acidobacteriota bacterium]
MKCYHRTKYADAILEEGFRDREGNYMTSMILEGVFLSDRPLDENEGAFGPVVLELDVPESKLLSHELIEDGKPYREFCVPAKLVNQHGPPRIFEASFQNRSRDFVLMMAQRWDAAGHQKKAEEMRDGFASFKSVRRRLQFHGEAKGIKVFDDFAHHPTEIKTTLEGLRTRFPSQRLWAVFEPRTATSKRKMFQSRFVEALAVADNVILTPLYMPEKVPEEERLSVEKICELLINQNIPSRVLTADEGMISFLKENLRAKDVVLFMSNGDFNQIPAKLIKHI